MFYVRKYGLYCAWLLATLGTLGSLYFSELKDWVPCYLCWYQRICLFPLAIILWLGAYRDFREIAFYVLPQVALGFVLALYQVAIQEIPGWKPFDLCGSGPSCSQKMELGWGLGLGWVTLPMLSALLFFIIGMLLLLLSRQGHPISYKKKGKI